MSKPTRAPYECDCGERYVHHDLMIACQESGHGVSRMIDRATEDVAIIAKLEREISELKKLIHDMYQEAFEELHPDTAKRAAAIRALKDKP